MIDQIEIDLRGTDSLLTVYIDVADNSLSRRWLAALNDIIRTNLHLEKNYCWLGWTQSARNAQYLCEQINASIDHINQSGIDYQIDCDAYTVENTIEPGVIGSSHTAGDVVHEKMNNLHRYFEDLQGWSDSISNYYTRADPTTRWHIRQLNLLCHEYESLVLSMRKAVHAPDWRRPSQLMCWLNAPRFALEPEDYKLFGIETINRKLGGVYLGVNKAVGKHHWEVFNDEGGDSRVSELVTTGLRTQTEAAGDFDIEWARDPGSYHWQIKKLQEFRTWLLDNGFDPEDKSLTIGHPKVAQVDVMRSFKTDNYVDIWNMLGTHLDVYKIRTSNASATYSYNWTDADYPAQQIKIIQGT
jgi:hypothetical protein